MNAIANNFFEKFCCLTVFRYDVCDSINHVNTCIDNSDDDNEDSNLSCITDVSVSVDDEDMAIYRESIMFCFRCCTMSFCYGTRIWQFTGRA